MTRHGLRDKEIGEQLLVDLARYRRFPGCQAMFGFVFDPDHRINNPVALERDLRAHESEIPFRLVIAS